MHEIDWGQVITQIVGFLIVLGVLKKFAWIPVLDMLDERRDGIQAEFDAITSGKEDVASSQERLDTQLREIEAERRVRIQDAVQEGEKIGNEIKTKARMDAQGIIQRAEEQVVQDEAKAQVALRNKTVAMVVTATEKMLREKLDGDTHQKQIESFIDSLSSVKGAKS